MATQNSWNNQIAAAKTAITLNSGANNVNISTDSAETNVHIADSAATKKYVTMGSSVDDSSTTVHAGTGGISCVATNGAVAINSGTGTIGISTDASATTVNIATGGAAKVVTLGSTNGASSLALKTGTADFTLASATGTLMTMLDTGEATMPLQPAFLGIRSAVVNNVTGNGAFYTVVCDTESYDRNGDYNNGTGIFTAPVTGVYFLGAQGFIIGCTICNEFHTFITTSNHDYDAATYRVASAQNFSSHSGYSCDMDAADTAYIRVLSQGETGNTDDVYGTNATDGTFFCGCLLS